MEYLWHLHLLVFVSLRTARGDNDFFVAKNGLEWVCVTNTSSALVWIDNSSLTEQVSQVVPFFKNLFDCDLGRDDPCTPVWEVGHWQYTNAIKQGFTEVVLDRRWESFRVYKTNFVTKKDELLPFLNVAKFENQKNIEITLSILIEKQGHIFLCDDALPQKSNCYWFLMQGWNGDRSAIRKCHNTEIPQYNKKFPNNDCFNNLYEEKYHNISKDWYLSEDSWRHFKIRTGSDRVTLDKVDKDGVSLQKIFNFPDQDPINVKHLIIHSKAVEGLWKIHNYGFLITSVAQSYHPFGPTFVSKDKNYMCISLFLKMCGHCSIKFQIQTGDNSWTSSEILRSGQFSNWTEIILNFGSIPLDNKNVQLMVSTVTISSTSGDAFWAIDSPRLCYQQEYRAIKVNSTRDDLRCQLLNKEDNHISPGPVNMAKESSCDVTQISDWCVPCTWLFGSCSKTKVCQENGNIIECSCSAGYRGEQCDRVCLQRTYGHNCAKSCEHCISSCSFISGKCFGTGCLDDYTGEKCDQPPGLKYKEGPKIVHIEHTSVQVQGLNTSFITTAPGQYPILYELQFKEDDSTISGWTTTITKAIDDTAVWTIPNLKPDTLYLVRAIVIAGDKNSTYRGLSIAHSTFRTTCQELNDDNINVDAKNTSAVFTFELCDLCCKPTSCKLTVGGTEAIEHGDNKYSISGFYPYENYQLLVNCQRSNFTKNFRTLEGPPDLVRNVIISNWTSSSISLKWMEPKRSNGIIQYYNIHYVHKKHLACSFSMSSQRPFTIKTENPYVDVPDLIPYSEYEINVTAFTIFEGEPVKIPQETRASDVLSDKEILTVQQVDPDVTSVSLKLNQIPCEDLRGPLYVQFRLECVREWCPKQSLVREVYNPALSLIHLFPYTDYYLYVDTCRTLNQTCTESSTNESFRTKPLVPNQISEVYVYSKSASSISFRWKPPYPPTGIVDVYRIRYTGEGRYARTYHVETSSNSTCKVWSQYQCKTIQNLVTNSIYRIQVTARNQEPGQLGEYSEPIFELTTEEAPEAPYNLQISWSETNDLTLMWNHPNNTKGELKSFIIYVAINNMATNPEEMAVDEKDYNLTYTYTVKKQPESSRMYNIAVAAKNNAYVGHILSRLDSSPPPIPEFSRTPEIILRSNSTLTLHCPSLGFAVNDLDQSTLFLLISDKHATVNHEALTNLTDLSLVNTSLVAELNLLKDRELFPNITIGAATANFQYPPLSMGRNYTITVVLINVYRDKIRHKAYTIASSTTGEPEDVDEANGSLWALLLLLIIVPLIVFAYIKRRQLMTKVSEIKEMALDKRGQPNKRDEEHIPLANSTEMAGKSPKRTLPVVSPKPDITQYSKGNGEQTPEIAKSVTKPPLPRSSTAPKPDNSQHSKPIKITEFEPYIKESIENGELERQHGLFVRGQTQPWSYGELKVNKAKNRYNNLIAYDHTRVILEKIRGEPHSDYINANYIDGYKVPKAYIATQGPKPATLNDFWRMIWQEKVKNILMLANTLEGGKKKVEKYWPDINEDLHYGTIAVRYVSNTVSADFEQRTFIVTKEDQQMKVNQLHFTTWPDHGVPLYSQSLVPFLQKILQIPHNAKSPIVVHCSAGVGRTGTVILCDISLRMAAREGFIDMLRILENLRKQRPNMVDNPEQYKLAHLVVLECLVGMHTSIPCNVITEKVKSLLANDGVRLQMRYLRDTSWQDQVMKAIGEPEESIPMHHSKNRYQDLLPEIQGRIFLSHYPSNDETSSYINAIKVDGFRCPGRFIVTQQPLPNTVGDFWRLIQEYNISVIISLNEIDDSDKTSCHFWPRGDSAQMKPIDIISLELGDVRSWDCYDRIKVQLDYKRKTDVRTVEIISMKKWPAKRNVPNSVADLLAFWDAADALSRASERILITCHDGARASGLYVALCFVIEKIKLEQICDVCQAVRKVRHNRQQFVQDEEQFTFLYEAALQYVNSFQPYANFN